MATDRNKGTGLRNVSETWDENERRRSSGDAPSPDDAAGTATGAGNDLERLVKEEAAEYDHANKENRTLGGDRATVNDDPDADAPAE